MSLAVQFSEYGTPDVLRVVDVPPPTAGPGQVRLAVRAAGVNPIDWKILHGDMRQVMPLDLPGGLGSDVVGVVDQVGEGVTAFGVGDEVLGASLTPSYAQLALADPAALVVRPASVPWEVAGTLAGAGITAWEVLNKLKIAGGETLLVHAAAGGVGTFAVQLAVDRGVRVIGTASEANHERLRAFGAEPVTYGPGLVERVRAVSPRGVDAVLDASGRGEIPDSIELMRRPGAGPLPRGLRRGRERNPAPPDRAGRPAGPERSRTSSPSSRRVGCRSRSSGRTPSAGRRTRSRSAGRGTREASSYCSPRRARPNGTLHSDATVEGTLHHLVGTIEET